MRKKKIDSWLLDEWLKTSALEEGTKDNYRTWIYSLKDKDIVDDPFKDFVLLIQWFMENGETVYALSVLDRVWEGLRNNGKKLKNPSDISSALVSFEKYVKQLCISQLPCKNPSQTKEITTKKIKEVKKSFNKSSLHKLDGMDALIHTLGEEQFIKYAVENSYFFHPDMVEQRFVEIARAEELPIRRGDYPHNVPLEFNDGKYQRRIKFDKDNNTEVRKVINVGYTGYTVSSGQGCIFQNYKISHIWGKASDPRYFTALWNLVIIPAWANDLMDKENAGRKSLASKLRATYMKICHEQYEMGSLPWPAIKMDCCPSVVNPKDVQKGTYYINQFNDRGTNKLSPISRNPIIIK